MRNALAMRFIPAEPCWDAARCRGQRAEVARLFFSDDIPDIDRAKRICAGCPLARPCLHGALARREPWGVWGGELLEDGHIIAQKRKRGRPRKPAVPSAPAGGAVRHPGGGSLAR